MRKFEYRLSFANTLDFRRTPEVFTKVCYEMLENGGHCGMLVRL